MIIARLSPWRGNGGGDLWRIHQTCGGDRGDCVVVETVVVDIVYLMQY